jgi:hypothetical protein
MKMTSLNSASVELAQAMVETSDALKQAMSQCGNEIVGVSVEAPTKDRKLFHLTVAKIDGDIQTGSHGVITIEREAHHDDSVLPVSNTYKVHKSCDRPS